ncbi:MAG: NADH:flavin oxidoreductase/NADH oxidase family protein [bacterium]|nr:NADH:flavin oxidoreductase/NADH oxidase family protein [bacterium]
MLDTPLTLPCGAVLNNRLAKAAMTERVAGGDHNPNDYHLRIYETWARSAPGLLISGNIMVQRDSLESGGNVVVEDERAFDRLEGWTAVARAGGSHFWAQLSHPGRQTSRLVNNSPVSASNVGLSDWKLYARPRPLRESEIEAMIAAFARTADIVRRAGFTGIQIHAAHGYLLSQFLSPLTNLRKDRWGGALENRARLLIEIVRAVREVVGPEFPIAVKLNSADFQRGGFSEDDSLAVIAMLERESVDLIEISGGNYESPSFMDLNVKESTRKREAYFIDFARRARENCRLPFMITGGFRNRAFAEATLKNKEADVIGMARPFLVDPEFGKRFLSGELQEVSLPRFKVGRGISLMSEGGYYNFQIARLARGRQPKLKLGPYRAAAHILWHETKKSFAHRLRSPFA